MKLKVLMLIVLFSSLLMEKAVGQTTTITLRPDGTTGKDVFVSSAPFDVSAGNQYGNDPRMIAQTWTFSGPVGTRRILIDFDWSSIPAGATVQNAVLKLYGEANSPWHPPGHSGSNASTIYLISSSWDETAVNWATQPTYAATLAASVPASTSSSQNYSINITSLVQEIMANPGVYHGLMLRNNTEQTYRSLLFWSSDAPDSTVRPELVVTYTTTPATPGQVVNIRPCSGDGEDTFISSTPAYNDQNVTRGSEPRMIAQTWTFGGVEGTRRILINFDLSQIPSNAVLTEARLKLFGETNSPWHPPGHSGTNTSTAYLITQPWDENTVNWSNAPTHSTSFTAPIPQSLTTSQDYDINVTNLVSEMLNNPSAYHGFLIRNDTEETYTSLLFWTSNASDSTKWPILELTFDTTQTGPIAYSYTCNDTIDVVEPPAYDSLLVISGDDLMDTFVSDLPSDSSQVRGNEPRMIAQTWTFNSVQATRRLLVNADLSVIPNNAAIQQAVLHLYGEENSPWHPPGHSGVNASTLYLTTSHWHEDTVVWHTQPSVQSTNSVAVPQAINSYQDYELDVTLQVQAMLDNPGMYHGWMLQNDLEQIYNSLLFFTREAPDSTKHPRLEIFYNVVSGAEDAFGISAEGFRTRIYPNPVSTSQSVQLSISSSHSDLVTVRVVNNLGQVLAEQQGIQIQAGYSEIPLSTLGLSAGIYRVVSITSRGEVANNTLVVQ